jgi:hypothetical protein
MADEHALIVTEDYNESLQRKPEYEVLRCVSNAETKNLFSSEPCKEKCFFFSPILLLLLVIK